MASRRRLRQRQKSRIKRLQRHLIEYRFSAAEGLIGVIALGIGLWLLWPSSEPPRVDHRQMWQQSLAAARATGAVEEDPGDVGMAAAEASGSVSVMGEVIGHQELERRRIQARRLAQVAETMPAIGPEHHVAADAPDELMVFLPDAPDAESLEAAPPPTTTLAALSAPRRLDPREMPPWLSNAVPTAWPEGRPGIAVVIDDLGLNRRGTAALNKLKAPLTLAFLPYAGALERQTLAARHAGHELMLHVPMEPSTGDFPGPNALLSSLTLDQTLARFRDSMQSFEGFAAVNNHMGSRLTTDRERMRVIMRELRARGLAFLDSRTTSRSVAADEARRQGVPHAVRDVFLDNELGLGYVLGQLQQLERVARRNGSAIAIGHPHSVTIEALRRWLPTLERKGFTLVPASAIIARRACQTGLIAISNACGLYVAAHNTAAASATQ